MWLCNGCATDEIRRLRVIRVFVEQKRQIRNDIVPQAQTKRRTQFLQTSAMMLGSSASESSEAPRASARLAAVRPTGMVAAAGRAASSASRSHTLTLPSRPPDTSPMAPCSLASTIARRQAGACERRSSGVSCGALLARVLSSCAAIATGVDGASCVQDVVTQPLNPAPMCAPWCLSLTLHPEVLSAPAGGRIVGFRGLGFTSTPSAKPHLSSPKP